MRAFIAIITIILTSVLAHPARAQGGKWTPQQVLERGQAWVTTRGFGLPLDKLWNEKAGGGLLANAVQLPGCSGSFISADGLLVTNHHCVVSILQEHSTPQANLGKRRLPRAHARRREGVEGLPGSRCRARFAT